MDQAGRGKGKRFKKFVFSFRGIMSSCFGYMGSVVPVVCPSSIIKPDVDSAALQGRHNCLWCHTVSSDLKLPLAQRVGTGKTTPRTLESLRSDHQSFLAAGGRLDDAKYHHNVIEDHFFNIPLENVLSSSTKVHPYIILGMYSWSAPLTWYLQSDLVPAWRCPDRIGPEVGQAEEW